MTPVVTPRRTARLAVLPAIFAFCTSAMAQDMADDMVGQSQLAWQTWKSAMTALEKDKADDAIKALDELAKMDLSALRLALMAERTGTLRFEQAVSGDKAGDSGKALMEKITAGRKQKQLAEDGWHFAAIGRFEMANANFKALGEAAPDPVALLELSRYNPNRHQILIKLMTSTDVGPSAKQFLDLLAAGEEELRKDPVEITVNIEKLGGTPRTVFHATAALKASGEYAVPQLLRYLTEPSKADLRPAIIKMLPQLGRSGLNPLVIALETKDQVIKQQVIAALGEIGYKQALPYLARIAEGIDKDATSDTQAAARAAMKRIDAGVQLAPAALFVDLAEAYHADLDSIRADPRVATANVWYFREGQLVYVAVPREIFNDIMAMRCCEAGLKMEPDTARATALWVASNLRRESKLGMNVESEEADPRAAKDGTRPENYPRSIYFARSAGPLYNHMVLARAVKDRDPGVALGSIAALAATAGEASMVGAEDAKQPLVDALTFPNRLVRAKAGIAIARTLPISSFNGASNVIPVINEALTLSSRKAALVVDPSDSIRNKAQAILRAAEVDVAAGANLNAALDAARSQRMTGFDVILLGSDVTTPDLNASIAGLRSDFVTAATPILIIVKSGQNAATMAASRQYSGVAPLNPTVIEAGSPAEAAGAIMEKYKTAAASFGLMEINDELAAKMSLEAADALRMLAVSNSRVLDVKQAEPALVTVLNGKAEPLQIKAASVLARIPTATAQSAIANVALDAKNSTQLRVAAFGSLAESARTSGKQLAERLISAVIDLAMNEKDLVIRTAGSQALGALNLPSNRASEIIRAQSRG